MNRYRLQYANGPRDDDHSYDTRSAAKGQLTRAARRYQNFSMQLVDQKTGEVFVYDRDLGKIVKRENTKLLDALKKLPAVKEVLSKGRDTVKKVDKATHVNISPHDATGKLITKVYDIDAGWVAHKANTGVPGSGFLFNFDLSFNGRTLLVLDNYGAERLSDEMSKRLLENCTTDNNPETGITLGVDRKTGAIFAVAFAVEKRKTIALVLQIDALENLRVPKDFLPRLDELKSCKRPFWITITEFGFYAFHDREIGYRELEREHVVVGFDFRPLNLEIMNDSYRTVGTWT
jgi:hypothetical protein